MGRGYEFRFSDDNESHKHDFSMQDYWIFNCESKGSILIMMSDGSDERILESAFDGLLSECEIKETGVVR